MIKVFVTGGTGLLGADLIKTLIESGRYAVMALRRSRSDMSLLGGLESKVEWIEGDVLDLESIEKGIHSKLL